MLCTGPGKQLLRRPILQQNGHIQRGMSGPVFHTVWAVPGQQRLEYVRLVAGNRQVQDGVTRSGGGRHVGPPASNSFTAAEFSRFTASTRGLSPKRSTSSTSIP